jgi:hypothetical protein
MGRPLEDPPAVIQLMVDLLAAEPEMGERGAALSAAKQLGMKGPLSTHVERLRKRFARERMAGLLPDAQTWIERGRRELRADYAQAEASLARIRADLPLKEQEARALGLDLIEPDLSILLKTLEREKDELGLIAHAPPSFTAPMLRAQGLSADAAEARFLEAVQRHAQLERQIEVLRKIRDYRQVLESVTGVFTQD